MDAETKEAVSYYGERGIGSILRELASAYPDAVCGPEPILGFTTSEFNITLEPAAQLEISIMPMEDIEEVEKIYTTFCVRLNNVISKYNYEIIRCGYQPASKVRELPLIPKQRYEFMDAYFASNGTRGINMMRGTASTQVSVDYRNEDDFRRKIQAAYFLSPYLKLLTDNTPVFEGEPNQMRMRHSWIWEDVDSKRCGITPGVMSDTFGFADYAEYLYHVPPIFISKEVTGTEDTYSGDAIAMECMGENLTNEAIEHLISMVFPDVRLKKYIEIRPADSMDPEKAFAYVALLKGLIYNEAFLDQVQMWKKELNLDEDAIRMATATLSEHGWEANLYGQPVRQWHGRLVETAKAFLEEKEQKYLKIFEA